MKTRPPVFSGRAPRQPRGVALVIVLGFLVLISALVVAFFSSVQTELTSAKSYAAGASVKQLAETTTNVVMSQISDATKTFEVTSGGGSGKRLTWASQPGLIHSYGDDGRPDKTFKLYSSWNMVDGSGTEYLASKEVATEVPNNWAGLPARFTDLNAPVLVPDEANGKLTGTDGKKYFASYPIVDPEAKADGFTPGPAPGYAASTLPTDKPAANKVAMPASWLYVLQNGTITAPASVSADGLTANWGGALASLKPSAANPVVGRIAFWTDDETSKVNVNTASEPTSSDTPRALTLQDLKYGQFQPANQEFQRYPGHPASVALSPVLFPSTTPGTPRILTKEEKEALYAIVPRVQPGGTQAATVAFNNVAGQKIATDSDRLFASMDEFLFDPSRNVQPTVKVDAKSLFFLTATSRAPEVNLFGLPRISLWPVASLAARQTAFDKLAAFCSTLGDASPTAAAAAKFPFYFIRKDSTSGTVDWSATDMKRNAALYTYLQNLTSKNVPGFGGNFQAKLTTDRDQVLTEIFDYIRCTNLRDPQRAATGGDYYAANGQVTPIVINDTKGFGRFHTISQFGLHFICSQQYKTGRYTAQTPTFTLGPVGATPADQERYVEVAFLFEPFSPSMGFYKLTENMSYEVSFTGKWTIDEVALNMGGAGKRPLINGISHGYHNNGREHGGPGGIRGPIWYFATQNGSTKYPYTNQAERIKVGGLANDGVTVKRSMVFGGGDAEVKVYGTNNTVVQTFRVSFPAGDLPLPEIVKDGTEGYRNNDTWNAPTPREEWWSFHSYSAGGTTYAGRYRNAEAVPHSPGEEYRDPARRWDVGGANGGTQKPGFKKGGLFRREDIVRTMVPNHGDMRLVAAQTIAGNNDPTNASKFVRVREDGWFYSITQPWYRFLHIFHNASGPHFHFGFSNEPDAGRSPAANAGDIPGAQDDDQLVWQDPAVKYHYSRLPEIRAGAGKLFNKWGDFDNGPAQWMDGAYINKPDEGNQNATNNAGGISYRYWSWNDDGGSDTQDAFFSPNRLVPSAGMLGSLPTGVKRNQPWQTLLFRPQKNHPGNGDAVSYPYSKPPDHLLMDLFWMPICEPYAISEPFSTAGKVNMNYEIAPFTYIKRSTALRAAFKGEEPLLIPNAASKIYKLWDHETNDHGIMPDSTRDKDPDVRTKWLQAAKGQAPFDKMRRLIDPEETLKQIDRRFESSTYGIFRSPTQISELHLVRTGESLADYESPSEPMWKQNLLTGDNTRERPYTNLLAKLTTKSNSFTVHMRVQVLRKRATNAQDAWIENQDQVVSEYRGSTLIERYIDAGARLPDFAGATNSASGSLDDYYKFRVISSKKFTP